MEEDNYWINRRYICVEFEWSRLNYKQKYLQ